MSRKGSQQRELWGVFVLSLTVTLPSRTVWRPGPSKYSTAATRARSRRKRCLRQSLSMDSIRKTGPEPDSSTPPRTIAHPLSCHTTDTSCVRESAPSRSRCTQEAKEAPRREMSHLTWSGPRPQRAQCARRHRCCQRLKLRRLRPQCRSRKAALGEREQGKRRQGQLREGRFRSGSPASMHQARLPVRSGVSRWLALQVQRK